MLLAWESEYCENGLPTKTNLQIQHKSYQNIHEIFTEIEKNPEINLKQEKTPPSQSSPEHREQYWRDCHSKLQYYRAILIIIVLIQNRLMDSEIKQKIKI